MTKVTTDAPVLASMLPAALRPHPRQKQRVRLQRRRGAHDPPPGLKRLLFNHLYNDKMKRFSSSSTQAFADHLGSQQRAP